MDEGNVLYNDKKFATLLYQWHCDAFTEYSKVSDAGAFVKNKIYDFIDDSEKTVLVVDCENSDPYKLCATLKNLDYEVMQKITAIILFDDVHTATAWRILENYTRIPVEHIMIERIKQNKPVHDASVPYMDSTWMSVYAGRINDWILELIRSRYYVRRY